MSEQVSIDIPGVHVEPLNQDLYRITFDPRERRSYPFFLKCKKLAQKDWDQGHSVVTNKWSLSQVLGFEIAPESRNVGPFLFDYQTWLLNRALDAKKYGVWADTGLGKTAILLEWARIVSERGPVLIVCPLSVAEQTREECEKFYDESFVHRLDHLQPQKEGIWIINYERLKEGTDFSWASGVILDECAILRNKFGTTHKILQHAIRNVAFRLALSATPAPNEYIEYANIALWLGVTRSVSEFFSTFFIHDEKLKRWRPKKHAETELWKWISSWAIYMHDPEAWGFDPVPLPMPIVTYHKHLIEAKSDTIKEVLFDQQSLLPGEAGKKMKRANLLRVAKDIPKRYERIQAIRKECAGQSVIWAHHNEEQRRIKAAIGEGVMEIDGSTSLEKREEIRRAFVKGEIPTLLSKPSVLSQGVNLQVAEQVIFSSLSDSFDAWYQAKNRVVRRGGKPHVDVHVVYTNLEQVIVQNIEDKQRRFFKDVKDCESIFIDINKGAS